MLGLRSRIVGVERKGWILNLDSDVRDALLVGTAPRPVRLAGRSKCHIAVGILDMSFVRIEY